MILLIEDTSSTYAHIVGGGTSDDDRKKYLNDFGFKIYYLEAQCIKECWEYTKCLNANTEENWFKNATRDWCTLNNNDLDKFNDDFNEFLTWKSEDSNDCIEYILEQIND